MKQQKKVHKSLVALAVGYTSAYAFFSYVYALTNMKDGA